MKTKNRFVVWLIVGLATLTASPGCAQQPWRDAWQQPVAIMDSLGIVPGMVVGEAGAGDGYFTFHLSRRVGPNGRIYANDINRRALGRMERRCERENIVNITTVVGDIDDPLFPENTLDMVVIMRAFHDFTRPVEWMANVLPAMKPEATLAIIDYDPDRVGSGGRHFMSREEVLAIMRQTSFELLHVFTFLDRDNIYLFRVTNDD